jgi:hypothetical protein
MNYCYYGKKPNDKLPRQAAIAVDIDQVEVLDVAEP